MNNTIRDENGIQTLIGTLANSLGVVGIMADPLTGRLKVQNSSMGNGSGSGNAQKNQNSNSGLLATSSVDGSTIPVFGDSSGRLLINSN